MQKVKIKKVIDNDNIKYIVPALELKNSNNSIGLLIPHPQGNSTIAYDTLEEAVAAIKRAGLEYILPSGEEVKEDFLNQISQNGTNDEIKELLYNKFAAKVNDSNSNIVTAALSALDNLGDERSIPIFMEKLSEDNEAIRNIAIKALVKEADKVTSILIDALSDSNWVKRNSAISCLEKLAEMPNIENEKFIVPLLNRVEDKNPIVQVSAITALGKIYKIMAERNMQA